MADLLNGGTFGGYANVTPVISGGAQTAVLAEINKLIALIPDAAQETDGSSTSEAHTDFDQIPPHTAVKLQAELVALKAAIDAAPSA